MPQTKQKRSLYLDIARTVAILSISLNHAVNRTFTNYNGQYQEFLNLSLALTIIKTTVTVFSKLGVPLFLMISGALLLKKRMDSIEDVKQFYRHNLLSLFLTAEIWYVIIYWCKLIMGIDGPPLGEVTLFEALGGMIKTMLFIDQNTLGSMWYMPMILCLYTTLPFLIMAKDRLKNHEWVFWIPAVPVFLYCMFLPAVNGLLHLGYTPAMDFTIREADLMSIFYLYLLAGWALSTGKLSHIKSRALLIIGLLCFCATCLYQFYAYSCPIDYVIGYEFPLLIVCAGVMFELMRRYEHLLEIGRTPLTYISRISLGIYFVHILAMIAITMLLKDRGYATLWRLLLLEGGSVGISIGVIAATSRIPLVKKYLYLIK